MTELDQAEALLEAAPEDPNTTLREAEPLLSSSDRLVGATAHFAIGLAHRALANGSQSTAHLERAADLAAADLDLRGRVLRSLAFNYSQAGDHPRADATIAESIDLLRGQERDLSLLQQAFLLLMRGEHRQALPVLSAAVDSFTKSGDDSYLELTLYNRALAYLETGEYEFSIVDLQRSYEIAIAQDHKVSAAEAALHLSQVMGWTDDLPGAMEWQSRSAELRAAMGAENPLAETEHAFVLIQARLLREAEEVLRRALPDLEAAGDNHAIAVAGRLALAEVLIERGDPEGARDQIALAAETSPPDGRWRFDIASARHRTAVETGDISVQLLDSMERTAEDMEANGEPHPAAVERFRATATAAALGEISTANRIFRPAERFLRSGPLWLQIQAWTAQDRLRLARGNRRAAGSAIRAGQARVERYRSGIGATDLRMYASDLGADLAAIGLNLAVTATSAQQAFSWTERLRLGPTFRRTDDVEMRAALADLRRATAAIRTSDSAESHDRLAAAERRVTTLSRRSRSEFTDTQTVPLAEVQSALDGRTLVEYIENDGRFGAIVATSKASRLITLGPVEQVADAISHLQLAAERIARPSASPASKDAAIASALSATETISDQVVVPLGVAPSRVVLVPSESLQDVPWGLVWDVPVEAAPSAGSWLAAKARPPGDGSSLIVTGPGLDHADDEAQLVASYTGGTITGSAEDVAGRLPGVARAHFACHTRPRSDNPMFSSLVLHDGEMTLHDIERLERVPATIVLATCAGGGTLLASGSEVMSLAGSFLTLGARQVLAPLFTVSDEATSLVVSDLYRQLSSGLDPAIALRKIINADTPGGEFTAGSFLLFGAA